MAAEVLKVDASRPDPAAIERAAVILRAGGLVVFPTETVYGVGANALDAAAVARIFAAKGRPANNPVIVHVESAIAARRLTTEWTAMADVVAARFWPGPLTLVVQRAPLIPDVVAAGGPTVALRVSAHPVALALIRAAGVPIAAPSANRSGELSATHAWHVDNSLGDRVDLILDAGPSSAGIESTVLDVTGSMPRLLRPGPITLADLEEVVGPVERIASTVDESRPLPAPGMLSRHYAPRTRVELVQTRKELLRTISSHSRTGDRIGVLSFGPLSATPAYLKEMAVERREYESNFYGVLHDCDGRALSAIVVEMPPDTDEWLAVRDRLRRAASP